MRPPSTNRKNPFLFFLSISNAAIVISCVAIKTGFSVKETLRPSLSNLSRHCVIGKGEVLHVVRMNQLCCFIFAPVHVKN
jgi:hypothetical protein